MRVAFFDPFSGVSGDMVLGALIDAGVPVDGLRTALAGLDLRGYHLQAERIEQRGVTGTRVTVALDLAVCHPDLAEYPGADRAYQPVRVRPAAGDRGVHAAG
jgi:uncharacterized protein (DUF111 family)